MKWLLTIFTLLVTSTVFGQGFTYSYVDPCSKKLKTIYLNSNESVTVNYLGVIGTFSQADFQNGIFSSWIQTAQSQAASQPCDELKTQTQTNQNIFLTQNIISTLTSITAASTMNIASGNMMSNALGNSTSNSSENQSSSPRSRKNSDKNGNQESSSGNQANATPGSAGGQGSGQGGSNTNSQNPNSGAGGENQPQGGNGSNPNTAPQTGGQPSQPPVSGQGGSTGQTGNPPAPSGTNSPGSSSPGSSAPGQPSSGGSNTGSSGSSGGGDNGGQNSGGGQGGNQVGQNGQGSSGNSGSSSGSSSGTQGQSQGQNVREGQTPPKSTSDQGQSGNGGTTNSVANAAEATSSSSSASQSGRSKVRVGSIVGTGDIVAIRSAEDNSNQFKGTMSVTKSNTNNTKAKGFLLNFTSTVNNSNLTLYTAFSNKAKTNTLILANSSMLDFDANFFNTTTALESKRFGKLTVMAGANFTVGKMAGEGFNNLSGVGGGFYPFKMGKKISGSTLLLAVYSPYTKFYEGKWWESGVLLVPFSSWDYTISKSFKYNVSFSGTYQVKGSVLNYQILTGGKILL